MNRSNLPITDPRWCSWCGARAPHRPERERARGRTVHRCTACGLPTVQCRACENMARAAMRDQPDHGGPGGAVRRLVSRHWNYQFCAEHDGSIADFERAGDRIAELPEFAELMKPRRRNLSAEGQRTGAVLGGAVVLGAGAWLTAPAIVAALGVKGALGTAAVGAGLGGRTGYSLANAYLRDIPDFAFHELRPPAPDCDHRVVVVNGFLTQDDRDAGDWREGLERFLPDSGLYYLNWEAETLHRLGRALGGTAGGFVARSFVRRAAGAASGVMLRRFSRTGALFTAADLAANPWHSAMVNAERTGLLLAEAISRTDGRSFTLMGHSLGARVVFFALMALASKDGTPRVRDAMLMGAAVGRDRTEDWQRAAGAVTGRLYNCYSDQDRVLRFLYQAANVGLSRPAGIVETQSDVKGLINLDCSELVGGHNDWKHGLPQVLARVEKGG